MLQESILQYFRPSFNYHLSLRPFVLSVFEWLLKTCFTVLVNRFEKAYPERCDGINEHSDMTERLLKGRQNCKTIIPLGLVELQKRSKGSDQTIGST